MKKVLLINGHPDPESYNYALARAYAEGLATTGATLQQIDIASLQFNPNLQHGYRKRTALEPDLLQAIEQIKWADHLVWVFPMWWYGYPAVMKGFIDRTFLPGITFEYIPNKPLPKKLLKGKTGHIIITADTPGWYNYLFMHRPAINQFKKGTLAFCGVHPVKLTYIAPIRDSSEGFRKGWLEKVRQEGASFR
ncbi:Putative NADPH-quinone reductase (modulator of drug activity B) [Cnuella takakiae]|uniref:Putative NADPH-quinone reductase (Modulator of drug activity B) n=1 Tax=Cnuella takakiae TaxID=1302690 RepID=A0A1M4XBI8_9BACT|nr:NAD(P)H-dependent oxidoreductase [Cnuella takakiae]OLY94683.1 NAD(P)H dehydrogenase [Cnuella takakiae]SHE90735.1 Putative NADPH-quinone reductase (modulator of drug activity B) [Cnuella takakiae]